MSTYGMDKESAARVDRLIDWCKKNKVALAADQTKVEPKTFAVLMAKQDVKGRDTYWMDILRKEDGKSFGSKKARQVEVALDMPPFYLDGGTAPPPSNVLRLIDLSEDEMSLVLLYRELTPPRRDELQIMANKLHNHDHPVPSVAHPFANAPAPGAPAATSKGKR